MNTKLVMCGLYLCSQVAYADNWGTMLWGSGHWGENTPVNNAEKGFIRGNVYDSCSNKPLDFADIQFDVGKTPQSGDDGEYQYSLPAGDYTVNASKAGYQTTPLSISISAKQTRYVDFSLLPNNNCPGVTPAKAYKAVILAGGGATIAGQENHIWASSRNLADKAYKALKQQGFDNNTIWYLSADPVSPNNKNNVDGAATLANLEQALTTWAAEGNNEGDVVIYLISHGGKGTLYLNQQDKLTAEQLAGWLKTLQSKISGKVTVIIDACYSGSFIAPLAAPNRYVMTSTDADLTAVVSNDGLTSFSYYFWDEVVFSSKLREAYGKARRAMSQQTVDGNDNRQNAQLDSNGDRSSNSADYDAISKYCFGQCKTLASLAPVIDSSEVPETLSGQLSAKLSLRASAEQPIVKAWATLQRPDAVLPKDTAIAQLPSIDLSCDQQGACQGEYGNFNVNGKYRLTFYVQDEKGNIAPPRTTYLTQTGRDERNQAEPFYDFSTGALILKDVLVNGQHYYAELQNQGNFAFKLGYIQLLANTGGSKYQTQYSAEQRQVSIPHIFAGGQFYAVSLSHDDNFIFRLSGDPKAVSE